ncbi:hypothetical protein D5086_015288 [Populus alba]|uniref:Uncharacterized protein n=1 Tax=Populus alba TaxID=43335 RepID=A0ACC4C1C6_POPAL
MASTPSDGEVAVFTDTNMDTHIAMGISPDITVADFKRELEKMHFNCFPKLGEIKVYELKVRRNNCFYHLLESLPIKYAFQGLKGNWFLHVEIRPSNSFRNQHLPQCLAAKDDHISDGSNAIGSLVTNTRKNDTIPNVSTLPQVDIRTPPRTLASPLPTDLRPGSSGNKLKTTSAVGKLMMTAANKLKISSNKQRPALSFYRFRSPSRASFVVRRSIFDISDSDE